MRRIFVDPYTGQPLEEDGEGNLFCIKGNRRDVYRYVDGCCDFSVANAEVRIARTAYDDFYAHGRADVLTLDAVTQAWSDETVPWRQTMLESLGSVSGRQVLLLGNGESYKEFYLLHLGAQVVFTDLSLIAARRAQAAFRNAEFFPSHREQIEFHAVDAMHLPFADESFDVIYGTKFVGFLGDLPGFFAEVKRCLKPGGICRFSDDASSPAWELVRRMLVLPIKARIAPNSKDSLASIRSATSFGFGEELVTPLLGHCGFSRLLFIREYFFLRVAQLCWGKLVRWDPKRLRYARPLFRIMKRIDNRLANTAWMRRNALGLTWGFDK